MKRFIEVAIIFIIIPVFYLLINYFINRYFINSHVIDVQTNVLIVGNSHNRRSIDTTFFKNAKNIAQGAEPYFATYLKLKKLCVNNKIDTLILNFFYGDISAGNDKKFINKKWSGEMFKRLYAISSLSDFNQFEINYRNYFYVYIKNLCLYPKVKHDNYIGSFNGKKSKKIHNDSTEAIERHYFYEDKNVGISYLCINYLDSIINLADKNNMKLILVTAPLHSSYINNIPTNFQDSFFELKDSLINEKIMVLDLSESIIEDKYFYNSDHLNNKGAKKFTKILIDTLNCKLY